MPAPRLSMRKVYDVLRLHHEAGLGNRQVARCLSISHSTVRDYLRRAKAAGLSWPLPGDLGEAELDRLLFPPPAPASAHRPLPAWPEVHRQMRRKGMTLQLLWQEYLAVHPEGYQYSRFCDLYRQWQGKLDLVMRHDHKAGEKLFVDYAGQTAELTDPETGEVRPVQIFVAVLGASNYTYAEATLSQALPDWTGSHQRAFAFFGGVPEIVVCDNLKSGVTSPHRYEPELNPTYQDLATHYSMAVMPARVRKPRDKAKAEAGVLLVERWILARLRERTFFSLSELNEAIGELLGELNDRPFQKMEGSRRSHFEEIDRPALRPLPPEPYVFATWKKARVHIDYHVEVEGHYYSVPYKHARAQVDVRLTGSTVEVFLQGRRIASHARSLRRGRHTSVREHMPPSHRHASGWTPERIIRWAVKTGPETARLVARVIEARPHAEQGYRSALGILRLGDAHGPERLEAAAQRALALGCASYRSLASILKNGLDAQPLTGDDEPAPLVHENIRGADYYEAATAHHALTPTDRYEC